MKVVRSNELNEKGGSRETKMETLFEFHKNLNERIEYEGIQWEQKTFKKRVWVRHNKKIWSTSGDTFEFVTNNEKFRLSLIPNGINSIEIWWIQVYDKGNGLGTDMMNKILDVSDELGIGVKVIPVDIDNKEKKRENLYRLRDWYRSFGFKNRNLNRTPELYYEPQLEQFKQVS